MPERSADTSASEVGADLTWLNEALFASGGFRPGGRTSPNEDTWLGLPNLGSPRRLLPSHRKLAVGALANRHDAMSRRRRVVGAAAQRVVATGILTRLGRGAITLDSDLGVGGDRAQSVIGAVSQHLPGAAGIAVTLGPPRYNRKPVIQFLDADGASLAFAKVGCSEVTNSFVAHETHWMRRAGEGAANPSPGLLRVPRVIASLDWAGCPVLVIEAIPALEHAAQAADADRLVSVATEVAALGPTSESSVADNPFVAAVLQSALRADDAALATAVERVVGRHGSTTLRVGPWHGDFSPWNMVSSRSETWLIDWEFAADAMPVGLDLVHNQVMVATHLEGVAIDDALVRARRDAPTHFSVIGGCRDVDAAMALYLLELRKRDADLAVYDAPLTGFGDAALSALDELVGRS